MKLIQKYAYLRNLRSLALSIFGLAATMVTVPTLANAQQNGNCESRTDILKSMAVPFFNDVPYASKPDVLERYGASVYEQRTHPISIDHTVIDLHEKSALILNQLTTPLNISPDAVIKLKFAESTDLKAISFALIIGFDSGKAVMYHHGDQDAISQQLATINETKRVQGSGLSPQSAASLGELEPKALKALPCNIFAGEMAKSISGPLQFWGLYILDEQSRNVSIEVAGIGHKTVPIQPKILTGDIGDANTRWPSYIALDYENGISRRVTPALDGRFIFEDEFPDQALRISLKKKGQEHYPVQGRWIGLNRNLGSLDIIIEREHQNIDGHKADENCPINQNLAARALIPELRRPSHVMRKWCGTTGTIQELYNRYFVNIAGMHDQDFNQKPNDNCLRVAHLGHSSVQAQQVPLHLKHNILASEILSMKLQRCVYINTFAGDISIVSEPRIEWIIENYKPDMIIFAVHRQMIQLLTPDLLNATFGYKRGHANTDSFDLKDNGELEYLPADPRYALVEKDPTKTTIDDYPLSLAYNLPLDAMPDIARKSFDTVSALLTRYKNKYPELKFGLEYAHTIAECEKAGYCKKTVEFRGKKHKAGAENYAKNIHSICDKVKVTCVTSPFPQKILRGFPDLVYQYDAHYTKLGNYWQAQNIAKAFEQTLK